VVGGASLCGASRDANLDSLRVEGEQAHITEGLSCDMTCLEDNVGLLPGAGAFFSPRDKGKNAVCGSMAIAVSCPMKPARRKTVKSVGREGMLPAFFSRIEISPTGGSVTQSASSTELRLKKIANNYISNSAVRNCNRLFWLKNDNNEARRVWNIDKEMGFSLFKEEDIVINSLQMMENRDSGKTRCNRKECSVSDDEIN